MKKFTLIFLAVVLLSQLSFAGGIVTNTNQSASFVRMLVRDASTDIDAVYFNPAGLTQLEDGFYISASNQFIFQDRKITNDYSYLNNHQYIGNTTALLFPDVYLAYKTGRFAFSAGLLPIGGGGSAEYQRGLPSFELGISDLVPALRSKGVTGYSSDLYFNGSSIYLGYQAGVSYKINDMVSIAAGARYVQATNTYKGHIESNYIYFAAGGELATTFFSNASSQYAAGATQLAGAATQYGQAATQYGQAVAAYTQAGKTDSVAKYTALQAGATAMATGYAAKAKVYGDSAKMMGAKANLLANQEADVTQKGTGITPFLGVNLTLLDKKLQIGIKYEFITKLQLTNSTAKDLLIGYTATGIPETQFPDGAKINADIPAMLSIGASYLFTPKLLLTGGIHYYWDKNVNWDGQEKNITNNSYEYGLGGEYAINEKCTVSAGYLFASSGVAISYNTDMSYDLSSSSFAAGLKIKLAPKVNLNLGCIYTDYYSITKNYTHDLAGSGFLVPVVENYTKTSWDVSIGLDFQIGK